MMMITELNANTDTCRYSRVCSPKISEKKKSKSLHFFGKLFTMLLSCGEKENNTTIITLAGSEFWSISVWPEQNQLKLQPTQFPL